MGPRIRKAVFWQDAPIVREQNHGTHPNTRKDDITSGGFVSGCSVVKKNGIATQPQDHLPNGVGLLHQLLHHCS